MIPSQQKLAERLMILNDRGQGMLTRIYNIKKVRFVTKYSTEAKLQQAHSILKTLDLDLVYFMTRNLKNTARNCMVGLEN